ncbi:hypothetical protein R6Q59_006071 [Mikania micrantha]
MGNCCLKESRSSTMVWAESADENDHWVYYSDPNLQQKQSLLSYERSENRSDPSVHVNEISNNNNWKNREVKIMLSKKKLGELLGKMKMEDLHNIPVNQLLDRLIDSSDRFEVNFSDDDDHQQHQSWKPNLQSIPEED